MENEKSGAGYGNHGGDAGFCGQDGKKSGDYEQGEPIDGVDPGDGENEPKPGFEDDSAD